MDLVINYQNFYEKRIRDLGTFKYELRSLAENANIFDKVFLIYGEDETILPDWLNKNKFTLVKHSDFIPEDKLPTFNQCVIETNMHNISGLSEQFVYLKEDSFFMKPCVVNDFFTNGKSVLSYSNNSEYSDPELEGRESFYSGIVYYVSIERAYKEGNEPPEEIKIVPEKGASPMFKDLNASITNKIKNIIDYSAGMFEDGNSISYEVFLVGEVRDERTISGCKRDFIPLHLYIGDGLLETLNQCDGKILTVDEHKINDETQFNYVSETLTNFMSNKFNNKCKYEI